MGEVAQVLRTLSLDRLVAIARSCGIELDDARVSESVADAIASVVRTGRISVSAVLDRCTTDELLRMRLCAALSNDDLAETAPEILRYKIGRALTGNPVIEPPPEFPGFPAELPPMKNRPRRSPRWYESNEPDEPEELEPHPGLFGRFLRWIVSALGRPQV